jgi:DNA-directed RNA polymerase subunit RPC12/RpoP
MVVQYKCPNCGADMAFDSTTGMLHCDSCGRNDNIESMPKQNEAANDQNTTNNNTTSSSSFSGHEGFNKEDTESLLFNENEVNLYHCKNCGAELITDKDTTATTCSFCGAGIVLGDRLTGSKAPAKVIPFSINKQQAQEAFRKWCKKGLLTPKGFMTANRIKSITGLYVPFWLYDLNGRGEVEAECTKVRKYTQGDYIYTETKHFRVYRKVDLNYLKVPVDASEKMNDNLMDKLEPYQYTNLKDFNMPYLAGYIAEKYNYDDKELFPRVQSRVSGYVDSYIHSTISGYDTTRFTYKDIHVQEKHADYVLLPVWMVCYDYKQSEHTFAMNGQTGKIVGTPPLSKGKIAAWFGGISGASFIIIKIIALLLGGSLL